MFYKGSIRVLGLKGFGFVGLGLYSGVLLDKVSIM